MVEVYAKAKEFIIRINGDIVKEDGSFDTEGAAGRGEVRQRSSDEAKDPE